MPKDTLDNDGIKKPENYKDVAKKLGVRHLFGRWGLLLHHGVEKQLWTFKLIPLDGWITQTKEVYKEMEKRDFEL